MKDIELHKVTELLENGSATEAKIIFEKITPAETKDYFMVKGQLQLKFQQWGAAYNAFSKVLELDPENPKVKNHLQLIQNILSFWNPDQFNP